MNTSPLIICDMDGTLMDSHKADQIAKQSLCQKIGISYDATFHESHKGLTEVSYWEKLLQQHDKKYDPDVIATESRMLYLSYAKHYNRLFAGATRFLQYAHNQGRNIAIYSNESRDELEQNIRMFGLERECETILSSDDVPHPKPDPSGYHQIITAYQTPPEHVVIIEDSPTGLAAAYATGAHVVQIDHRGTQSPSPDADCYVQDWIAVRDFCDSLFV